MSMERELARALRREASRAQTQLDPDAVVTRARRRHRSVVAAYSTAAAVVLIAVAVGVPLALLPAGDRDRGNLAGPTLDPPVQTAEPDPGAPAQPTPDGPTDDGPTGDAGDVDPPTDPDPPQQPAPTPGDRPAPPTTPNRNQDQNEEQGGDDQAPQYGTQSLQGESPTGGPFATAERTDCGAAGGASNITAIGPVDCDTARQVAAAAGDEGQPYDTRGFSCATQPTSSDYFYLCDRGNEARVTFTVDTSESDTDTSTPPPTSTPPSEPPESTTSGAPPPETTAPTPTGPEPTATGRLDPSGGGGIDDEPDPPGS